MDDVFNYLPSRVSAVLMIAAAFLTGMDAKRQRRCIKETGESMPVRILRRRNQSVRGRFRCSWQEMHGILGYCIKRDDRRSDPSCRGRRHQTGRKADVCDSGAYPAVCRNDPVLVFLVRKETKSWNICMAEIFILMKM